MGQHDALSAMFLPGTPDIADTQLWERLVHDACVALDRPADDTSGPLLGTGFLVGPGLVATCAHVVAEHAEALPARLTGRLGSAGRDIDLTTSRELYFKEADSGLDLAFLHIASCAATPEDRPPPPHVPLSNVLQIGDPLWAYGHPDGMFRPGQSATFHYEGTSRRSSASPRALPRLRGTPVGGGFSGSPVINLRTGAVCGMLATSDHEGSSHLVPASDILASLPAAARLCQTPRANRDWLRCLSDDQIRAGGRPFPGPTLRAYVQAVARAAEDHPYPGLFPSTRLPPLTQVYVRQWAQATAVTGEGSATLSKTGGARAPTRRGKGRRGPATPGRTARTDLPARSWTAGRCGIRSAHRHRGRPRGRQIKPPAGGNGGTGPRLGGR